MFLHGLLINHLCVCMLLLSSLNAFSLRVKSFVFIVLLPEHIINVITSLLFCFRGLRKQGFQCQGTVCLSICYIERGLMITFVHQKVIETNKKNNSVRVVCFSVSVM